MSDPAPDAQASLFANFQYEIYAAGLAGDRPELPIDAAGLQEAARAQLTPEAYGYVAGGAGSEATMAANLRAFAEWEIVPRMLRDVSARDLQKKDGQWARAKGFDTFAPMGPWVETDLDWRAAPIRCLVGGQVRQSSTTADMVFDVPTLVSFISRMMTLEPGDVILTGTPEGVSPIKPGDKLDVEIGGIGILKLHVEGPAR